LKKYLLLFLLGINYLTIGQFKTDSVYQIAAPESFLAFSKIQSSIKDDSLLTAFNTKFAKDFDDSLQFKKILVENPDLYEMNLFSAKQKQSDFLKTYLKTHSVSNESKLLVENTIKFQYWYLLLAHPVRLSNMKTGQTKLISLPEIMTQALDFKKINLTENLQSEPFRKFLFYYVTYFNSKENKFEKYKDGSKAAIDKFNFADNNLKGEIMQYYLASYLNENCNLISPSILKSLVSNLESKIKEKISIKCAEAINKKEVVAEIKVVKDEWALVDTANKPLPISLMKGKIVYIDFWATWCGPCRKEFPSSMAMIEKLTEKQKKKIEFLFISIDEDKTPWKTAIEKNKFGGKHGWIMGGWGAKLLSKFQVVSIPRYMIMDETGKIINQNAPRPSDPETFDMLLKLAGEK
jgi:thiol-disulfide isomerase/thioredoxin